MQNLQYQIVACAIKKDTHLIKYGISALDPYLLSLDILVERFCMEISSKDTGIIIAEKRNTTLDHQLDLAWLNLKIQGTHYVQAKTIERKVIGLFLRSKKDKIAGLEIADLIVSPIGRKVIGKPIKEDFAIIESKFRKDQYGRTEGYGLIILPKQQVQKRVSPRYAVTNP